MFDFFSWLLPPPSAVVGLRSDFYPFRHGDFVAGRKPILTPCWNCSFLLFVAFVVIIIQNGLP